MCKVFIYLTERKRIMSNKAEEFLTIISKIIRETTRFSVPRLGQVSKIDDPDGKGRVLVHIPSLNWMTDEIGAWCFSVDKKSLITPAVGDWVIVQWIDGNIDLPVYTGIDAKMKDMLPAAYTDENNQILFENRGRDFSIRYDETGEVLNIGAGAESFLKGDTFDTWLTNTLKGMFDVHIHTGGTIAGNTGPPTIPLVAASNHLSTKIKGE